jgi:3-oxoacyl-[acyl-carrier protein] reductase
MVTQRSGSIIFMTSTWVKQPVPAGGLSSVMRSALSTLSKQMAVELAPLGVRVNQIQPGATATDRMKAIVEQKAKANGTTADEEIKRVVEQIPLSRWGDPEEIASLVAFIASGRSGFITGASVQIDGGAIRSTM